MKINEVDKVTTLTPVECITAIAADGSLVQIPVLQLGKVMLDGTFIYRGQCHSFDDIYGMGSYMHMNTAPDYPGSNPYGMLIVFGGSGMCVQLYMNTSSKLYIRQFSSGLWDVWKQISFT